MFEKLPSSRLAHNSPVTIPIGVLEGVELVDQRHLLASSINVVVGARMIGSRRVLAVMVGATSRASARTEPRLLSGQQKAIT